MNTIFAMLNGWEILLIIAGILILFGAKKLPELARGLGQGIREFKKSTREASDEAETAVEVEPPQVARRITPPAPPSEHVSSGPPARPS